MFALKLSGIQIMLLWRQRPEQLYNAMQKSNIQIY